MSKHLDLRSMYEERVERAKQKATQLFDKKFPQQEAFVRDEARLKALFCTRRSAKSYTCGLYLVHEALNNAGCNCLFIGLTKQTAKDIIWKDILKDINTRFNLKIRFNETLATAT